MPDKEGLSFTTWDHEMKEDIDEAAFANGNALTRANRVIQDRLFGDNVNIPGTSSLIKPKGENDEG